MKNGTKGFRKLHIDVILITLQKKTTSDIVQLTFNTVYMYDRCVSTVQIDSIKGKKYMILKQKQKQKLNPNHHLLNPWYVGNFGCPYPDTVVMYLL